MPNKSTTLKILLTIFFISTIVLSYLLISRISVCGNFISKDYDIIQPGKETSNCEYIVLRKKSTETFGWVKAAASTRAIADSLSMKMAPIDTAMAAMHVRWYNEKHNPNFTNTSYIDMDRSEMLMYLIDVAAKWKTDKSNICRIYLADRAETGSGRVSISAIITAKCDNGEVFTFKDGLKPLNWGSLCPPPYENCITAERGAELFRRAINGSPSLTAAARQITGTNP